jgi:hypothetical protein
VVFYQIFMPSFYQRRRSQQNKYNSVPIVNVVSIKPFHQQRN